MITNCPECQSTLIEYFPNMKCRCLECFHEWVDWEEREKEEREDEVS